MKKIKGFTLLEMLIAITIFSIIAVSLYSCFHAGTKVLKKVQNIMQFNQDLRIALETISLDLRNSLLAPFATEKEEEEKTPLEELELSGPRIEEEPVYYFYGEEKLFSFVSLKDNITPYGKFERKIYNITYYLKNDGTAIMRSANYNPAGKSDAEDEELLKGIENIEFLYSYQGDDEESEPVWKSYWDQEESVPLGVKIKLKLKAQAGIQNLTKTVLIPVGKLGIDEASEI